MLGTMDISQFSPRLIMVITFSLLALITFSMFPMVAGAGNTVKLHTEEAGVVNSTRADKILKIEAGVQNVNKADWSESITLSETTGGGCAIDDVSVARPASEQYWLPTGQKARVGTAGTLTEKAVLKDCTWEGVEPFFQDSTGLLLIIIEALGLLIAVSPIGVLGSIGYMILSRFQGGGMTGLTLAIISVLGAIVCVSMLGVFIDFISITYNAIDPNRFSLFEGGLAGLGVTIKQFWSVIFIVSFFGLAGMVFKGWWTGRQRQSAGGGYGESQLLT